MDNNAAFREIRASIASGNTAGVGAKALAVANENRDDPLAMLTCASLLMASGLKEKDEVIRMISERPPSDSITRFETARGLRSLMEFHAALALLKDIPENDGVHRERMENLHALSKYADALSEYEKITEPAMADDIRHADILCSLGKFKEAESSALALMNESPGYETGRCYCSVLLRSGRQKDAEKYAKERLKAGKESADSNALAAYVLYMCGKSSAAGGFASKAVRADNKHIGAMEILALCLAEKGKKKEAKIIAGAINEIEPGHPAALRILGICG